ncbi:MAG TPA: DUF4136 domain-containing protein [Ohtaekwangia sp.]|nr:DUF4136 domain-containing protein [Ohtaekwangia sp.]
MKKKSFMLSLLMIGIISAINAQEITVKGDRELGTDFGQFKTFYWASQVDQELDPGMYFLNDLVFKSDVRAAVQAEMEGLGYRLEPASPDLIVNFRAFDEEVRIKSYADYGDGYWGASEMRDVSDTTSYVVEPGTLLISLVDRKKGSLVWQGFASGLIDNNTFIKDEGKIREAVNLIFDEYGMRATDYDRTSNR